MSYPLELSELTVGDGRSYVRHRKANSAEATVLFFPVYRERHSSAFPCRLIVDPHEWLNDSSTVPRWNPANLLLW